MKKLFLYLLTPLLLVSLALSPALAGTREGGLTLSPMVGGYIFEGQQNMDNAPLFGFGIDYAFTKALSAELFYGYIASENDAGQDIDIHQGRLGGGGEVFFRRRLGLARRRPAYLYH
jgi:OOP family OmpA-OmpF porin